MVEAVEAHFDVPGDPGILDRVQPLGSRSGQAHGPHYGSRVPSSEMALARSSVRSPSPGADDHHVHIAPAEQRARCKEQKVV